MKLSAEDAKAHLASMPSRRGLFQDDDYNVLIPCRRFEDGDDLVFLALFVPTGGDLTFAFDDLGLVFRAITGEPGEFKVVFDKRTLRLKEIVMPDDWNFSKPVRN
jgi:hypothetical protein